MHTRPNLTVMFLAIFGGLVSGWGLFLCLSDAQVEATPEATPEATAFYQNGGPFPTFPLLCPEDMPISDGPIWRTITIGRSSLDDIEQLYGIQFMAESEHIHYAGNFAPTYSVLLTAEGARKWQLPQSADLCLVNGKIMALTLSLESDDEFPSGWIEDWVKLYGEPELVTWTTERNEWCWREVIWPQRGIDVTVDVSALESHPGAALVNSVTLFPYARGKNYQFDWPFTGLNRQPPMSENEGCPAEENPFDFEALLQVTSEQP